MFNIYPNFMRISLHRYKLTLLPSLGFIFSFAQNLPFTENFEVAQDNSTSFTSNGKTFLIESSPSTNYPQGSFRIQAAYPGTGWDGMVKDDKYIDNDGVATFGVNPSFKIKSEDFNFSTQSFYIFLADYNLQQFPIIALPYVSITGKENGDVIFNSTLTLETSSSATNGYVIVNLNNINGVDYSNLSIDELEISTSNPSNYLGFDSFTWTEIPRIITIWENGEWSNGEPTTKKEAILREDYSQNLVANTLTFEADVIVPTGITYTVVNSVNNPTNQVVFEDGAYLMQQNENAINTGNISFKRQSKPIYRLETLDWSSPVYGQNIFALSPKTLQNRFYRFNETTNGFEANININDEFQKGEYIAFRAPNDFNNYGGTSKVFEGTFTGVPNNGNVVVNLTKNNFGNNAVGNPYPSPIDLTKLISDNSDLNISKVFLWTHNQPIVNGVFTGNNWVIYSEEMGWSEPSIASSIIGVGQGFIVQAENKLSPQSAMQLYFKNNMRISANDIISYKNIEDNKFWLSLQKDNLSLNSTLIGYKEGSTKMYESNFDATPMQIYPGIYSLLDQKEMTIQGRGNQFDIKDNFGLAINVLTPGSYTISLPKTKGIFAEGQSIYLIDKESNTSTDLTKESYNFISDKGHFTKRFEISYEQSLLNTNDLNTNDKVEVYTQGESIFVKSTEKQKSIKVYNLEGKLINSASYVNSLETMIKVNTKSTVLIVWIELYDGSKISKKVIVK